MISRDHSLTETLAQHLLRAVCPDTCARARLHLLDWMGCVAGARRSQIGGLQHRLDDEPVTVRAALLGNVLEMDDVHRAAILHPGPVVWPAALARPERGLDAVLMAAVRGYEATIAIGASFDAAHYAYWHNTATAGVFGAAAAAACLLESDPAHLADALGLAGSVAGGLWQMRHEPVMAKQWHIAHAVRTGMAAASYAAAGITGPRFVLEGPQGLYAATCRTPGQMALGEGWRIGEVSFKPWAACRHAHPAIDAALELRSNCALDGPILVETFADALTFCDRPDPLTPHEAKFSLQHAVAIVAERGVPTLADFEPGAIAALAATRRRVTVRENATISARYPAHFGAIVSVGNARVELVDTLGDPERPLSHDGIVGKARALFDWGGLDHTQAERGVTLALDGDDAVAIVAWLEEIL